MKKLIKNAKDTMKLGIGTMAGQYALGSMSNISGMPVEAKTTAGVASAGLGLVNVGQFAKTGLGLTSLFGSKKKKKW